MSAKELMGNFVSMSEERIRDNAGTILSALSLLASVEDGEGIVRELLEGEAAIFEEGFHSCADTMRRAAARITLDAQEKAALQATLDEVSAAIGDVRYMDPPDGGDVPIAEQVRRMRAELASVKADAEKWRAYEERKRRAIDSAYGKLNPLRAAHPKEGA